MAVALSAVAGYVDALGWMLFSHVYVANMTGNTVALGRSLADRDLADALARVWPIVTFTSGLFASELVYEVVRRRGRRSSVAWTLGLELCCLVAVTLLPWPHASTKSGAAYYLPTGLLALAMGLQNATLVRVGASSVYTTHLTGNLTRLGREAAHLLLWLKDGRPDRAPPRRLRDQRAAHRVLLMGAMWTLYALGAVLGSLAADGWNRRGALPAVLGLAALIALDLVRPLGGHETPPEPHPMF
ncbi:MAG TPA: YoaK family protein [Polyangia bacterium]|nr:YoaK family protein [Polyangia bacterium]